MMREERCPRECLADGPLCRIDRCGCGMLHVTLGPLTVRLEPAACRAVHATLAEALDRLDEQARPAMPRLGLVDSGRGR